jgi:fermentation-respiration switch protein FrsA (DUF1100 family)
MAARPQRRRLRLPAVLLGAYVALCAAMYALQHQLQYRPDPAPMDAAQAHVPGLASETLATPDGERLVAWWRPPADAAAPAFLYLPGNGANLAARDARFRRLAARGAGLLAVSWRGYGGSTGTPSEAGLRTDALTAYAALARRVDPSRIVIFGESLGTTLAVQVGAERPAAALVLDSGFASVLDVAERRYWWLPVSWLLREPFRADLAAPRVAMPVLQVHCRVDPVTPLDSARLLNALLPRGQPIVMVEDRCHTPSMRRFEDRMWAFVGQALAR